MTRLKLGALPDDKPVKLTIEIATALHRDLCDYAELLGTQTEQKLLPEKLIAPMLERFIATDRGFASARKALRDTAQARGGGSE